MLRPEIQGWGQGRPPEGPHEDRTGNGELQNCGADTWPQPGFPEPL